jgi:hypothetical protein
MRYILFFSLLLGSYLIVVSGGQARPVSYPGGWTAMLMNNGDKNTVHLHFSPSAKISLGYKFEYWRDQKITFHGLQMNHLLQRWNKQHSQANLYFKSGAGIVHASSGLYDGDNSVAGFGGIAADWENRRYFVSYENRYTEAGKIDDFYEQSARVGWAPYEGAYGDLHTWIMVQVEHKPEARDNLTMTPMLRFFKDVHLMEFGVSNHGKAMLNYIYRY